MSREMAALRCLLVDDHPAILRAIAAYLRDEGIEVVGTADTGALALELAETRAPGVVLLDVRLPDLAGVEVAHRLAGLTPSPPVVLYTGAADSALVREALDVGVRGIVLKEAPLPDLTRALNAVAGGALYLDPLLGACLVSSAPEQELTGREREVLRLLTEGCTHEEIGARLFLAPETVRSHVRKAVERLGARNRTEAVAIALRRGLIA